MKLGLISLWLFLPSAFLSAAAPVPDAVYRADMLRYPQHNLKSFAPDFKSPLASRVQKAPDFYLQYMRNFDNDPTYAAYEVTSADQALLADYLAKLPAVIQQVMRDRLVAIYFVKNFRGSGWTDVVLDENDPAKVYLVLVLNPEVLHNDLSAWLTKKENTCFSSDDPTVKVEINAGHDYQALLYILLHEGTHMVDYVHRWTPYVQDSFRQLFGLPATDTSFTFGWWSGYRTPVSSYDFPERANISFYGLNGLPQFKISDALSAYRHLAQGPFVSLYGSLNWAEDLAESDAFYFLTHKLKQPYEIVYSQNGKPLLRFSPMDSALVKKRFPILEKLVNGDGTPP